MFFQDSLLLDFNFPVVGVDFGKASVLEIATDVEGIKDTTRIGIEDFRLEEIYSNRYALKYAWKPGHDYSLFMPSACFTDFFGRLADTAYFNFKIPALETYGQVGLRVQGLDSAFQYVLQMVTASDKAVLESRVLLSDSQVEFPYVNPATVSFVLIRDDNRNGLWDSGRYLDSIQPEKRWFFGKNLQVEADWRIEETWNVSGAR